MNRDEIQEKLSSPTEIFYSGNSDDGVVYLAYPVEKEVELRAVALVLKSNLTDSSNYIEINKMPVGTKYAVTIASPQFGTPLFFGEVPCPQSSYNDMLNIKKEGGTVKLGFYVYQKMVKPGKAEVEAAQKKKSYDEHAIVQPGEPYFISIEIAVEGRFAIKSDDQVEDAAGFLFLKPGEALAIADAAREKVDGKEEE